MNDLRHPVAVVGMQPEPKGATFDQHHDTDHHRARARRRRVMYGIIPGSTPALAIHRNFMTAPSTKKTVNTASATNRSDFPIIVIGTSAGGQSALSVLVAQLPADFPAAILIVQHMAATSSNEAMLRLLADKGNLPCKQAAQHGVIKSGYIYLAQPDHHLMISQGKTLATKGARENRARPAIDPLFRSAAVEFGNRVIGVILTGYLDDGTSGMEVIRRCGGICVVQDPADAAYPDMPQNVLNHVKVDHCVPLAEMGSLLTRLALSERGARIAVPADVAIEAKIAQRVLSDLESVDFLGTQVPFNCPGCGGVLWQMKVGEHLRFRCHTGHAYTVATLLAEQTAKMEETLWVALRMFEENKNLLVKMGTEGTASPSYAERVEQSDIHIRRIKAMLHSNTANTDPLP
ncbi:chemotaxis protein CheB [Massilia sp. CCM 8734]|uniref:chemotaxis protein CheB n=1 Tax=Massilia sp. CCM 8734 TaxID=2609283 RepID=UPI001AB004C9|nr:chemotaxis protein CheB [Massilia sp. CCM 8734]